MKLKFLLQPLVLLSAAAAAPGVLGADPQVDLKTSLGTIRVELNRAKAPKSVDNFLQYVKDGHYNGTVFHRVIPGFMIQGGGMTANMSQKPTRPPIPIESKNGLKNEVGTLAMARTSDPNSATSQFFINVQDDPSLDYPSPDGHGYAVFGRVVEGMNVVDRVFGVPVQGETPVDPPVIVTAQRGK